MRTFVLMFVGLACISCRPAVSRTPELPDRFGWLLGRWVSADGANVETWFVDGDGLAATNVTYRDGEPAFEETIELVGVGDAIVYRAHPPSQPSHDFPLEAQGATWASFADAAHDFPKTIAYRREGDRLTATLTGVRGGQEAEATWAWRLDADRG